MSIETKFAPIRKGLLELAVLQVIAKEKVYAADILAVLKKTEFATGEGTLYPLLSQMRRDGLLTYEWVESESGPPRKYYSLTEAGKNELQRLQQYLQHLNTTIDNLK